VFSGRHGWRDFGLTGDVRQFWSSPNASLSHAPTLSVDAWLDERTASRAVVHLFGESYAAERFTAGKPVAFLECASLEAAVWVALRWRAQSETEAAHAA
jgi:hypothetical protein